MNASANLRALMGVADDADAFAAKPTSALVYEPPIGRKCAFVITSLPYELRHT